jgi:hypothetical protein
MAINSFVSSLASSSSSRSGAAPMAICAWRGKCESLSRP